MCAEFSVTRPRSHMAFPSKYPHFGLCSLLHVNPVHSRFRHIHVIHRLSYPLARLSLRFTVTLCGVVGNFLSHSIHYMTLGDNSSGLHYARGSFWTSVFPLQGVDHIESVAHWFPVWSFPF